MKTDSTPAGTDTVVVTKPDTSTLLKQTTIYEFGPDGTTVMDSVRSQWKYDNERRWTQATLAASGNMDTSLYTYFTDRFASSSVHYYNGALESTNVTTTYQHSPGRTDSIKIQTTGYGDQAGNDKLSATYFYYNQDGQDSIEKSYNTVGNLSTPAFATSRYYLGSMLDSAVTRDGQGNIVIIKYYKDGDVILSAIYNNGAILSSGTTAYTNIPAGALAYYFGTTKLVAAQAGFNSTFIQTSQETVTYQFDAQQRLSVMLTDNHGTGANQKELFIYY